LHGADAARVAAETARQTFEEGAIDENLPTYLLRDELKKAFFDEDGVPVLVAARDTELVKSLGEAKRLIDGRGLRVNDLTVTMTNRMLTPADLTPEGVIKLSLGKKRHVLLKPA
jgi:tyrosyl-tRNA synthetase